MTSFNPARILFFSTLISGTMIAVSANSWFSSWLGLELNLLSFVPIICSHQNSYSSESALKYFLIQALGSTVIIGSAATLSINPTMPGLFILISLLLKVGAAPLHFWFPPIMQGISFMHCIILMTVQKIAPLILISYSVLNTTSMLIIQVSSMMSSMVGAIGGLNQTFMRSLLAYSSINHMGWMLAAIYSSMNTWASYFIIYALVVISIITILNHNQMFHFNQIMFLPNTKAKMISILSLFSLGGLPPFLGFIPKLLVILLLAKMQEYVWLLVLLASALLTLFYYTRLSLATLSISLPALATSGKTKLTESSMFLSFINFSPILYPLITLIEL